MFNRLKNKWGVSWVRFILIFSTFAIGGSLCGYLGRKLLGFTNIDSRALWIIIYILLVTILWPVCVLIISIPMGQFGFFSKYLKKMGARIQGKQKLRGQKQKVKIAVFASGSGSNAEKIIEFSVNENVSNFEVVLIVTNKKEAGVLKIASHFGIPSLIIDRNIFFTTGYVNELYAAGIEFIVLAGFLLKVPEVLIEAYPDKIINIHPALLPAYGGKGMYGNNVHAAVIAAREKQSGITIHKVDGHYDNGDIILQERCDVLENDTAETLAKRVLQLEHTYFAQTINLVVAGHSIINLSRKNSLDYSNNQNKTSSKDYIDFEEV